MKNVIVNFAKYVNAILRRMKLPIFDINRLYQRLTYSQIRQHIPKSLQKIKTIAEWHPDERLNSNSPIYVMWWTGKDTMPPIVKICFNNLMQNCHRHPVTLLTKDNLFITFPSIEELLKRPVSLYEQGSISIQHLSDMVRTLILYECGGIWIDSTVFVSSDWDKDLMNQNFYSGRRSKKYANSGKSVTEGQWTSYFIGSVKGNPLLKFLYDGLIECYGRQGKIAEYYTMDYLFAISMNSSKSIRLLISQVPVINADLFSLEKFMYQPFNKSQFELFIKSAPFFKLNHRITYE